MQTRSTFTARETADVELEDDGDEISPVRVRIGLGIIAIAVVVAIGVIVTVDQPAAKFLFSAILFVGLFQTWRLFRSRRRG